MVMYGLLLSLCRYIKLEFRFCILFKVLVFEKHVIPEVPIPHAVCKERRKQHFAPAKSVRSMLTDEVTVVKIDVEGSEMAILSDESLDWNHTRLLALEFSVARCRKLGLGWRPFTFVLKNLEAKGFTHVYIDRQAWAPSYWRTGVSSFQESLDAMVFAYRQGSDPHGDQTATEMEQQLGPRRYKRASEEWKHFDDILRRRDESR